MEHSLYGSNLGKVSKSPKFKVKKLSRDGQTLSDLRLSKTFSNELQKSITKLLNCHSDKISLVRKLCLFA